MSSVLLSRIQISLNCLNYSFSSQLIKFNSNLEYLHTFSLLLLSLTQNVGDDKIMEICKLPEHIKVALIYTTSGHT